MISLAVAQAVEFRMALLYHVEETGVLLRTREARKDVVGYRYDLGFEQEQSQIRVSRKDEVGVGLVGSRTDGELCQILEPLMDEVAVSRLCYHPWTLRGRRGCRGHLMPDGHVEVVMSTAQLVARLRR